MIDFLYELYRWSILGLSPLLMLYIYHVVKEEGGWDWDLIIFFWVIGEAFFFAGRG